MMKSDVMHSLKTANLWLSFSISPLIKWALTILVLGTGIALVAYTYTHEQSRNHQLADQVDRASATLVNNNLRMRDLEGQLAEANLEMAGMKALVPPSDQTMTIEEKLYTGAADAGVVVNSITMTKLKGAEDSGYQSFGMTVDVTGQVDDQLRFAGILGQWLPTAEIASCSMAGDSMNLVLNIYVE